MDQGINAKELSVYVDIELTILQQNCNTISTNLLSISIHLYQKHNFFAWKSIIKLGYETLWKILLHEVAFSTQVKNLSLVATETFWEQWDCISEDYIFCCTLKSYEIK